MISEYKASLVLYAEIKQKHQKWIIHGKLLVRVATSEREGKLSNPRGHAAGAQCMIFFSKNYKIPHTDAARELCVNFAVAKNTVAAVCSLRILN